MTAGKVKKAAHVNCENGCASVCVRICVIVMPGDTRFAALADAVSTTSHSQSVENFNIKQKTQLRRWGNCVVICLHPEEPLAPSETCS